MDSPRVSPVPFYGEIGFGCDPNISNFGKTQCIRSSNTYPSIPSAKLRYHPIMPGALPSIMPGQSWRDTGHKALCPVSSLARPIVVPV